KSFVPENGGPRLPKGDDPEYDKKVKSAIASVLKKEEKDIDINDFDDFEKYFWYRYLFLGRGKPLSHNYVLSKMEDDRLRDNSPEVLDELIETVRGLL
ncbi:exonuclease, partial [Salmonella enterica]|nr:exonuclease [Salmonella enterica]